MPVGVDIVCQLRHMTYDAGQAALKRCIDYTQKKVDTARSSNDTSSARAAQIPLRLYKNELSVEEVIRARTEGLFHERCRDYMLSPRSEGDRNS
jgi:hypothetical protein